MADFSSWLVYFTPELLLVAGLLLGLMFGVFRKGSDNAVLTFFILVTAAAAVAAAVLVPRAAVTGFNGLLEATAFTSLMKALVFGGCAVSLLLARGFFAPRSQAAGGGGVGFEFGCMIVAAGIGMGVLISANSLITLYLGIELISLSSYVLAAYRRDDARCAEAGLKYFVLGALSSGLLLFGMSLVYGFTGSVGFPAIAQSVPAAGGVGLSAGLVFVLSGIAFKISAVPFHMWTPDVYEGAPTPVTAFFASAPKVAVFALLMRLLMQPFGDLMADWQAIVLSIAIASMVWGALAAIQQENIKRLLAYSSIGNMGYALAGMVAGTPAAMEAVTLYLLIYLVTVLGTFAVIMGLRRDGQETLGITQLSGLWQRDSEAAFLLGVFMLSLAGIPWLAGFFGKFYVFTAILEAGFIPLAVVMVLSSVVAAYYYLRIIKVVYFDAPLHDFDEVGGECRWSARLSGAAAFCFFLFPSAALSLCAVAARLAG